MQSTLRLYIRKEAHGGPQDGDTAFARRTACGQRCWLAAIFLRHTKFPDFHHHIARIDSSAYIGATRLADGGSRLAPPTDCGSS
jgi:hypothetical protein